MQYWKFGHVSPCWLILSAGIVLSSCGILSSVLMHLHSSLDRPLCSKGSQNYDAYYNAACSSLRNCSWIHHVSNSSGELELEVCILLSGNFAGSDFFDLFSVPNKVLSILYWWRSVVELRMHRNNNQTNIQARFNSLPRLKTYQFSWDLYSNENRSWELSFPFCYSCYFMSLLCHHRNLVLDHGLHDINSSLSRAFSLCHI